MIFGSCPLFTNSYPWDPPPAILSLDIIKIVVVVISIKIHEG
jgi:hypothetical protein